MVFIYATEHLISNSSSIDTYIFILDFIHSFLRKNRKKLIFLLFCKILRIKWSSSKESYIHTQTHNFTDKGLWLFFSLDGSLCAVSYGSLSKIFPSNIELQKGSKLRIISTSTNVILTIFHIGLKPNLMNYWKK